VTISMDLASAVELGPPVLVSDIKLADDDEVFQIAGTVRLGGDPAGQATVTLKPGGRVAVADSLGRYSFTGVRAGSYVLHSISADGTSSADPAVDVPATVMAAYDVSLPPAGASAVT
jgi:hypothetical protein